MSTPLLWGIWWQCWQQKRTIKCKWWQEEGKGQILLFSPLIWLTEPIGLMLSIAKQVSKGQSKWNQSWGEGQCLQRNGEAKCSALLVWCYLISVVLLGARELGLGTKLLAFSSITRCSKGSECTGLGFVLLLWSILWCTGRAGRSLRQELHINHKD